MVLLHATCVAIGDWGVLIRGPSGAGKSSLALALIDQGAELVADDYCELERRDAALTARAPAAISNKLEVRGYGIVSLPSRASVAVGLVVDLKRAADIPRLPETTTAIINGVEIAAIALDPTSISALARIRLALREGLMSQQRRSLA